MLFFFFLIVLIASSLQNKAMSGVNVSSEAGGLDVGESRWLGYSFGEAQMTLTRVS